MRRRSIALFVVCACLLLARTAIADDGSKPHLVTVRWLEKSLGDPAVLVLDASSQQLYAAQHIPGAVSADLYSYGLQEMTVADTERLYQSWGIGPGKKIVVYDQGGGMTATRVFFALQYHGFPLENLLILDGGLAKWQEAGLPVTKDVATVPRGTFTISKVNEDVRVRLPEVLAASGDTAGSVLVDALGANWHFGEVAVFDRAGHIPHGVLLPSADFYNPDKTFKSAEEINRMLTYLGIRPDQQIYTFCGGGVAASVPFFALKFIADYPKVKLFKESEMGWVQDERGLPYWTYDAPYLMRLSPWLQFWGGQILRMYGGAQVSIVDVRPAAQFNEGHVPFALNVPADAFRSGIADPGRLAGILGPAGVRASDEAVVVSGAGLTKDSALAFVMLEKLGQRKVSVFMDSMDRWAQLGYTLKKDATVVGPKKSPQDLSILPTTYPDAPRKDVMIADPSSTHGVYPKVFVASGKDAPAKAPDGKVVHVPYTDLLNPDGTPKAAKDIWSILTKAGVPRYAEIVCFSDDPGEAAVNYFVLKLMGFPDLKVLAPTS
jgi:thiosulfate/3-mercaptopyruvate sulfurtransferase